jgi:hypothetical protein
MPKKNNRKMFTAQELLDKLMDGYKCYRPLSIHSGEFLVYWPHRKPAEIKAHPGGFVDSSVVIQLRDANRIRVIKNTDCWNIEIAGSATLAR